MEIKNRDISTIDQSDSSMQLKKSKLDQLKTSNKFNSIVSRNNPLQK